MRIGEFEKASGLNRTTVRFYERRGLLKPYPAGDGNGYRRYGPEHVERARMIRMGQSLGFSIAEMLRILNAWDGKALSAEEQSRILKQSLLRPLVCTTMTHW